MEKWYSREFVSSTQTATRLVFNVGNCVDQSRILPSPPSRPPDSQGKDCYVYAMRGSAVTSIKELPVDELAPWNSKSCKSSTRFSEVNYDPQSGQIVMRRHAISDTSVAPGNLFACYYCRHPIFCLSKKIYYACYGSREACLPDTFVFFVYEFDGPEKLYARGYINAPVFSSAAHQLSAQNSHGTALLGRQRRSAARHSLDTLYNSNSTSVEGGGDGEDTPSSSRSLLDQFLQSGVNGGDQQQQCSLKFADYLNNDGVSVMATDEADNPATTESASEPSLIDMMLRSLVEPSATVDGYGEGSDGLMMAESGSGPLASLRFPTQTTDLASRPTTARSFPLHTTSSPYHPNNFKRFHRRAPRNNFPPLPSSSHSSSIDPNKRRMPTSADPEAKRKAFGRYSTDALQPPNVTPSLPVDYRHIHIPAAAWENFSCNCLCAEDELLEMHDAFAEMLSTSNTLETPSCSSQRATFDRMRLGRFGGCIVGGLPLVVECATTEGPRKLSFTCVCFRNNAVLTADGHPLVHPLAILVKSMPDGVNGALSNDYSCLLSELESRLAPHPSKSSRAFLVASEAGELDASKFPRLLRYPCVSLHCLDDFKRMVREKLSDVCGDVARSVEEDILGRVDGGDLAQSTGLLNSLRLEDFVRKLALVERKWPVALRMWFREKSGWIFERLGLASRLKSGFGPLESAALTAQFDPLREQLSMHLRPLATGELNAERVTSLLDEFTNAVLIRSAQALFDTPSHSMQQTTGNGLGKLRLNPCLAHLRVSRDEWAKLHRAARAAKLSAIGLGALPDEELLLSASDSAALMLDSAHLGGERSRRDKLALLNSASKLLVLDLEGGNFVTVDTDRRLSHFVGRDFYCQCHLERWRFCEHLCAVGLARPLFTQALTQCKADNETPNDVKTSVSSPATCVDCSTTVGEVRSEQDEEIEQKAVNFAKRPSLVEMIHCSGNGLHDGGELRESSHGVD